MAPETTSYCARCGSSLAPGAYFCLRCGTSVPVAPSGGGATVAPPVRHAPAALSHPHIIPIYAVKESEHVLYFVMKYVQGRALDSIIRDVGTLPIPMVQTILAHAGDALGYAHRHGVIHRDIKSANLMLDEDGWAVITDFGIAKVVQAEGLTMTGVTVGTPTYMSPEQCETRDVTGASDQYSLGVVAYEMLTWRRASCGCWKKIQPAAGPAWTISSPCAAGPRCGTTIPSAAR